MTLIERVDREAVELDERMERLEGFMRSGGFVELDDTHRYLLQRQYAVMAEYLGILKSRIRLLEKAGGGGVMATRKQFFDTSEMVDSYVNRYRMAKGRVPDAVALTGMQAHILGVREGAKYKGMTVVICK